MNEMEVQLQTAQADLRSAQKRIEGLQQALKGQDEEYSSGGEREDEYDDEEELGRGRGGGKAMRGVRRQYSDDQDYSSDGSYQIGQFDNSGSDFSSGEDETIKRLTRQTNSQTGRRKLLAEDSIEDSISRRRYRVDEEEEEEVRGVGRRKKDDDLDDEVPKKRFNWRSLFSDEEKSPVRTQPPVELPSRTTRSATLSDDEGDPAPRSRRHHAVNNDHDDELSSRPRRDKSPAQINEDRWTVEDEEARARRKAKLERLLASSDDDDIGSGYKTYSQRRSYKDFISDESDSEKKKPSVGRRKAWEDSDDENMKMGRSPKKQSSHSSVDKSSVGDGGKVAEQSTQLKSSGTDSSQASPLHSSISESSTRSFAAAQERRKRRRSNKGLDSVISKSHGTAM